MLRDTISAVKEAARVRWPEILSALGAIPRDSLDGKHHPCPRPGCGGKDRFRMIDEQAGAVLCSQFSAAIKNRAILAKRMGQVGGCLRGPGSCNERRAEVGLRWWGRGYQR